MRRTREQYAARLDALERKKRNLVLKRNIYLARIKEIQEKFRAIVQREYELKVRRGSPIHALFLKAGCVLSIPRHLDSRIYNPKPTPLRSLLVKAARNEAMKKQKRLKKHIKHIKHADDALKQLERVIQGGGSVSDAQIVKMEEAFAGIEDSPPCEAMEKAGKALPGIRNLCVQGFASSRGFFGGGRRGPRFARPSHQTTDARRNEDHK